MKLVDYAENYIKHGCSVVAATQKKVAAVSWGEFQKRYPTAEELSYMFSLPWTKGVAIITGAVSGNLEVIDIDCKYDLTGSLYNDLVDTINKNCPDIFPQLVIARTRSGGYHLYYRCETICTNRKLARRYATPEELSQDPNDKIKVLIETRGEKGFVIAYPTPGYSFLQHAWPDIPIISAGQRQLLLDCCMSFNKVVKKVYTPLPRQSSYSSTDSPLNDFDSRGDVLTLLVKHGWAVVDQIGERTLLRRPGATDSLSSGNFHSGHNTLKVFSTSTDFEPDQGYRPSAVFAILECGGNFKLAARKLLDMGFGKRRFSVSSSVLKRKK